MDQAEIDRINRGEGIGESLPPVFWEFALDLGDQPEVTMASIREVVSTIANEGDEIWPSDDSWRANLPRWLVNTMPELSIEEAERLLAATPRAEWNTIPWTFGSWLDAMRAARKSKPLFVPEKIA